MKIQTANCPKCSAPVSINSEVCEFCGAELTKTVNGKIIKPFKDFGIKSKGFFILILIGIISIYSMGWFFEDTKYWLNDTAILLWVAALPFWTIITVSLWSNKWGAILYGIILSILIFAFHTLFMASYRDWYFNNDYFGISGMFAGVFLASWLLGRLIHFFIRKSRSNRLN